MLRFKQGAPFAVAQVHAGDTLHVLAAKSDHVVAMGVPFDMQ